MSVCKLEEYDAGRSYPRTCLTCGLSGRCHKRLDRQSLMEDQQKTVKKFVSPCPPPTPYENELLDILIEECAEVIQRATKMKRFGVLEVQPGQPFTNAERLSDEVGDVQCLIAKCADEGLLSKPRIHDAHRKKWDKLAKYMQTNKESK